MANCCWSPDFGAIANKPYQYWLEDTGGWIDLWGSSGGDMDYIFSGSPIWGNVDEYALAAYMHLSQAMSQFLSGMKYVSRYGHRGVPELPRAYRTDYFERKGGVFPVAFFFVPDYYMKYVTPTYDGAFSVSSAIDFGKVGVTVSQAVINQLRDHQYFQSWRTWRDSTPGTGVPSSDLPSSYSYSRDDIGIYVQYVHFDDIYYHGGSYTIKSQWLSEHAGLLEIVVRADYDRQANELFTGVPIPIIFLTKGRVHKVTPGGHITYGPMEVIDPKTDVRLGPLTGVDGSIIDPGDDDFGEAQAPAARAPNEDYKIRIEGGTRNPAGSFDYISWAKTARKLPGGQDDSVVDMINRLNPFDRETDDGRFQPMKIIVNGERIKRGDELIEGRDWADDDLTNVVFDYLHWIPVQRWSSPDGFQEAQRIHGG